ncbi:hypothetical protein F383_03351 [Gossypium arboreum]|uniref:Uncharacterized protein n=1 Tax=Gossypium arboreum TaxID=29729 RepID=A0A0B0NV28_GOSAR|nr:hypothetical protein F383_03351 [Gossypium arboreum]
MPQLSKGLMPQL